MAARSSTSTLGAARRLHGALLSAPARCIHASWVPAEGAPRRTLFGWGKIKLKPDPFERKKPILAQDDLFHPLSKSPIPAMRARGERVRSLAPCPVSLARDGVRRPVQFECPDCGWPTHYSEKEWREDAEHSKYVARLREANEDEHDLRSGRKMTEFQLPGEYERDSQVRAAQFPLSSRGDYRLFKTMGPGSSLTSAQPRKEGAKEEFLL